MSETDFKSIFLQLFQVADCVCLMSLDKPGAIPVDTHVWQIAAREYLPHLRKNKSLTDKIYQEIGKCKIGVRLFRRHKSTFDRKVVEVRGHSSRSCAFLFQVTA